MAATEIEQQIQRVHVDLDPEQKKLTICVENHDHNLGWYPSATLCLPMHQLPLLQQALAGIGCSYCPNRGVCNIIPFPGLGETAAKDIETKIG